MLAAELLGPDAPDSLPLLLVTAVTSFVVGELLRGQIERRTPTADARAG